MFETSHRWTPHRGLRGNCLIAAVAVGVCQISVSHYQRGCIRHVAVMRNMQVVAFCTACCPCCGMAYQSKPSEMAAAFEKAGTQARSSCNGAAPGTAAAAAATLSVSPKPVGGTALHSPSQPQQ